MCGAPTRRSGPEPRAVEEVDSGGFKRWLIHNFRRQPSGAPKKVCSSRPRHAVDEIERYQRFTQLAAVTLDLLAASRRIPAERARHDRRSGGSAVEGVAGAPAAGQPAQEHVGERQRRSYRTA